MKIKIAQSDEDIQAIANLAEVIWHEHFTPIIGKGQVLYMVEKFQSFPALKNAIDQEGYQYYMAYEKNQLIGYLGIHPESDRIFISKLYIEKSYRGNGYSRQLIERLKQDFSNCHHFWLTVNKHNTNTIHVYQHMGFVITREQEAPIGNGFIMDDYIMELTD